MATALDRTYERAKLLGKTLDITVQDGWLVPGNPSGARISGDGPSPNGRDSGGADAAPAPSGHTEQTDAVPSKTHSSLERNGSSVESGKSQPIEREEALRLLRVNQTFRPLNARPFSLTSPFALIDIRP